MPIIDPDAPTNSAASKETSPAPHPMSRTRIPSLTAVCRRRRSVTGLIICDCRIRRCSSVGALPSTYPALDIPCYFLENIFVLIRCSISANAPRSHGFGYGILEPSSLNTRRFCSVAGIIVWRGRLSAPMSEAALTVTRAESFQVPAIVAPEVRALKAELAAEKDRFLRLSADFDNFRKRVAQGRCREFESGHPLSSGNRRTTARHGPLPRLGL